MKSYATQKNLSVLYLALICVLYYILTSGMASPSLPTLHSDDTHYIEIQQNNTSIIYAINSMKHLNDLSHIYNIDMQDGIKLIVTQDEILTKSRISGIKSLSLGVSIGVNSASKQDLMALPGIGKVTAESIVKYRENSGRFVSLTDLDKVPGIGKKTLESLEGKISLD